MIKYYMFVHAQTLPTLFNPWIVAYQAPQSMGFYRQDSRQEYWSELPFPPPGDLPVPWIKHVSLASLSPPGKPLYGHKRL